MKAVSRTAEQRTNALGFPKPSELIEMTGTHVLEASDRAIFNLLYQRAHDSGRLRDANAEWEIPLADIRQTLSKHDNNSRLRESLIRLKGVTVNISYFDENDEPREVITGLFDFFDIPTKELTQRPTLRYGLPRKLAPIIESSGKWGRIRAEIVCSMTSKYAIALYELVQLKANLDRCVEVVAVDRFRELLGVPPDKYERIDNLMRKVIEPALLQVNGTSDMGVAIEPRRRHSRAPVHEFAITWWRKEGDELRAAMQERSRSKLGRMQRLRGEVEKVEAALARDIEALRASVDSDVEVRLTAMRQNEQDAAD